MLTNHTTVSVLKQSNVGGVVLYSSIRKRTQNGFHAYGLTTIKQLENGEKVELKNVIGEKLYEFLKNTAADTSRAIIRQKRYCSITSKQNGMPH